MHGLWLYTRRPTVPLSRRIVQPSHSILTPVPNIPRLTHHRSRETQTTCIYLNRVSFSRIGSRLRLYPSLQPPPRFWTSPLPTRALDVGRRSSNTHARHAPLQARAIACPCKAPSPGPVSRSFISLATGSATLEYSRFLPGCSSSRRTSFSNGLQPTVAPVVYCDWRCLGPPGLRGFIFWPLKPSRSALCRNVRSSNRCRPRASQGVLFAEQRRQRGRNSPSS